MSALATRAHLEAQRQYYLTPLALVGQTAELLPAWIEAGVAQEDRLTQVWSEDGKQVLAQGYARQSHVRERGAHLAGTCAGGALPRLTYSN